MQLHDGIGLLKLMQIEISNHMFLSSRCMIRGKLLVDACDQWKSRKPFNAKFFHRFFSLLKTIFIKQYNIYFI